LTGHMTLIKKLLVDAQHEISSLHDIPNPSSL
jgi:hypothetical protein